MKSRLAVLTCAGVVVLLASGLAWQRGALPGTEPKVQKGADPQVKTDPQAKADPQAKPAPGAKKDRPKQRKRDARLTPPGPGRYLAFDVKPRDYKATASYVLEITHPSGKLTTLDLKKPKLNKHTIMVPVPELEPGQYKLIVIAETSKGPTRSKPLDLEIPKGT